jgi:nucleoside 2-deoxyribosyltransferase
MADWTDDPAVQRWFVHLREELAPMIADSAVAMSMWPNGTEIDPKMAVELGYMLLLDKPIIVVVEPGSKVPDNLVKVAVRIIEADQDAPDTALRLAQAIKEHRDG